MSNITLPRATAQQALEALEAMQSYAAAERKGLRICDEAITALRAALARQDEPDLSRCPQCNGPADNGHDRSIPPSPYLCTKCMAEPEPMSPEQRQRREELAAMPQQAEPVATVAENATTQQCVGETPPSDYRRGYWDGFNIGKREGRIEAEDALAQQAEPVEPVAAAAVVATQSDVWRGYNGQWQAPGEPIKMVQMLRDLPTGTLLYTAPPKAEPVEPVAWLQPKTVDGYSRPDLGYETCSKADYGAFPGCRVPPQRKPLTEEEILAAVGWDRAEMYMKLATNFPVDEAKQETLKNARAVERAAWEKNNG